MLVLYEKLMKNYSEEELLEKITPSMLKRLKEDKYVRLESIIANFDIDYTYDDFLLDYGERYKKYKEKRNLFNFFMKEKKTMREFSLENDLNETALNGYFSKGFTDKSKGFDILLPLLWETEELSKEIKLLNYQIFSSHIEVYGKKEELEIFKEKYHIDYKIIFHSKLKVWHLAFDGRIEKVIKYLDKEWELTL